MNRLVEIICIGNELLTGHTLNTNAQWIADKVTRGGGIVERVTVIRDEVDEIAVCVKESMGRRPMLIIITGGLGPTYDDKTLEGLARALELKLVVSKKAISMLKRKYQKTAHADLTPTRYKMAIIPTGAKPLENPVGHAPAVTLKHGSCTIFSLPGVPSEMQSVFAKHVLPVLRHKVGKFVRGDVTIQTKGVSESMLAPYLDIMISENPHIYVKSHPKGYNSGVSTLHVNISCEARDRKTLHRYLKKAVDQMKFYIQKEGGSSKEI
ncbi:MAG: molybdopterin-binding protein [Nitrososphaerales archaeon]